MSCKFIIHLYHFKNYFCYLSQVSADAPVITLLYHPASGCRCLQTDSITGTSTKTPTTHASAAPVLGPNRVIATATANSKKLLAPISAPGDARCAALEESHQHVSEAGVKIDLNQNGDGNQDDRNPFGCKIFRLKRKDKQKCQKQATTVTG
jgi:hypothetical protein